MGQAVQLSSGKWVSSGSKDDTRSGGGSSSTYTSKDTATLGQEFYTGTRLPTSIEIKPGETSADVAARYGLNAAQQEQLSKNMIASRIEQSSKVQIAMAQAKQTAEKNKTWQESETYKNFMGDVNAGHVGLDAGGRPVSIAPPRPSRPIPQNTMSAAPSSLIAATQQAKDTRADLYADRGILPSKAKVNEYRSALSYGLLTSGMGGSRTNVNVNEYTGAQTLLFTVGLTGRMAFDAMALPKGFQAIDKAGKWVRATNVAKFIEGGGKAGRLVVAAATYGAEAYATNVAGRKIIDTTVNLGMPKTKGINDAGFKILFNRAQQAEQEAIWTVKKSDTWYGQVGQYAKTFALGGAQELLPSTSSGIGAFEQSIKRDATSIYGGDNKAVNQLITKALQTRSGYGQVTTVNLIQAEAFANIAGDREVRLADKAGKWGATTFWGKFGQGFSAKIVPGFVEGSISFVTPMWNKGNQYPTFIPRWETVAGRPATKVLVGEEKIMGAPTTKQEVSFLNGITTTKTITETPYTINQVYKTTEAIPASSKFVPSKALGFLGGGGLGILTAGGFGGFEKVVGGTKIGGATSTALGYGLDIPNEALGDFMTPLVTGGAKKSFVYNPSGSFVNMFQVNKGGKANSYSSSYTKTGTNTFTNSVQSSNNAFSNVIQKTSKDNFPLNTKVNVPNMNINMALSNNANSGRTSIKTSNKNNNFDIAFTNNEISTVVKNPNFDVVTSSSTDNFNEQFNTESNMNDNFNEQMVTNIVFTPRFTPFMIPGGGGGAGHFGWPTGTGRVKGKYTPSLVAQVYNIRGKQPGIISGLNIRPIIGKATKTKKYKTSKKRYGINVMNARGIAF
ncbi:MAG: hypothetical protein KKD01_19500 [Proteobacteria bacterium]|nr:hypothetical protein [Pseudomonadota bacterium]